jgi:hypothetical protein
MDLPHDGREYARWTVTAKHALDAATPPDVSIDGGAYVATTWLADQVDKGSGKFTRVAGLLVRGPDIGGSGTQLTVGSHTTRIRVTDNPETVVRDTDEITVG